MKKLAIVLFSLIGLLLLAIVVPKTLTGLFLTNEQSGEYVLNELFTDTQEKLLVINADNYLHLKSVEISGNFSGEGNVNVYLVNGNNKYLIADKNAIITQGMKIVNPPGHEEPLVNETFNEIGIIQNETENETIIPSVNETLNVTENITENETLLNETIQNETPMIIENGTPTGYSIKEGQEAVAYTFENLCADTCSLSPDFNKTSYVIEFETNQAELYVEKVTYEYVTKSENIKTNISKNESTPLKSNLILNPHFENTRNNNLPENWFYDTNLEFKNFDMVDSAPWNLNFFRTRDNGLFFDMEQETKTVCNEVIMPKVKSNNFVLSSNKIYKLQFDFSGRYTSSSTDLCGGSFDGGPLFSIFIYGNSFIGKIGITNSTPTNEIGTNQLKLGDVVDDCESGNCITNVRITELENGFYRLEGEISVNNGQTVHLAIADDTAEASAGSFAILDNFVIE